MNKTDFLAGSEFDASPAEYFRSNWHGPFHGQPELPWEMAKPSGKETVQLEDEQQVFSGGSCQDGGSINIAEC